jgi:SPP1 gp7 family putative phage head morphogenesis protein
MPDPRVVIALRQFKATLLSREDRQMQRMANRWLQVERGLDAAIRAIIDELTSLREQGRSLDRRLLLDVRRYRSLLVQASERFEDYAAWASETITQEQQALASLALEHAEEALQLSFLDVGIIDASFNRLPIRAIEAYIGLAGNGAPVGDLLRDRMVRDAQGSPLPGVWQRLVDTLLDGITRGRNPRATARLMRDDLAGGLQKAMTIARTEQLRVYRQANADAYAESGVVEGHMRLTAHDRRVCPACLADEGAVYPLGTPIPDHPNGRCTSVAVLKDYGAPNWTRGADWFAEQPPDVQQDILGRGRFEAWRAGQFDFDAILKRVTDPTWGDSLQPRSLAELTA